MTFSICNEKLHNKKLWHNNMADEINWLYKKIGKILSKIWSNLIKNQAFFREIYSKISKKGLFFSQNLDIFCKIQFQVHINATMTDEIAWLCKKIKFCQKFVQILWNFVKFCRKFDQILSNLVENLSNLKKNCEI